MTFRMVSGKCLAFLLGLLTALHAPELAAMTPFMMDQGPTLSAPQLMQDGAFQFAFSSKADSFYMIQSKNNLAETNWQNLTMAMAFGSQTMIVDSEMIRPERYYRVYESAFDGSPLFYSINWIGYQFVQITKAGDYYVRCPIKLDTNAVAIVVPAPAIGTLIVNHEGNSSLYDNGEWSNPGLPVIPSQGFWIHTEVSNWNFALVGEVAQPFDPLPNIIQQPLSQGVVEGAEAHFSVTAQGASPLFYQWQHNGTNLLGATNATLTLSNVQSSALGDYRVVVYNAVAAVTSDIVTLRWIVRLTYERTNGMIAIHSRCSIGQTYRFDSSTNLIQWLWGEVQTNTTGDITHTETMADSKRKFFRLSIEP